MKDGAEGWTDFPKTTSHERLSLVTRGLIEESGDRFPRTYWRITTLGLAYSEKHDLGRDVAVFPLDWQSDEADALREKARERQRYGKRSSFLFLGKRDVQKAAPYFWAETDPTELAVAVEHPEESARTMRVRYYNGAHKLFRGTLWGMVRDRLEVTRR